MDLHANDSVSTPSWGVRINPNRRELRHQDAPPKGCPEWAKPWDWLHYGLVVWDNALERVQTVPFGEAVKFLEQFRTSGTWKSEGVVITRKVSYPKHPEPPPSPHSRKKATQPAAERPREKPEFITIDEERIRLRDQAATDFYAFLESHEAQLRRLAAEDERIKKDALDKVYALIFRSAHERESKDLDVASRPLSWTFNEASCTWASDQPPNRATVLLTKDSWFWYACIEQPDRFKHESSWYATLEDALSWAEQELATIRQEADAPIQGVAPPPPRLSLTTLTIEHRERLASYWITPAALEPARMTYRVVIYLDHVSVSRKSIEISFGKQWYYDEKYPTPVQLARKLHLDPDNVDIEKLVGGLFRITSLASYTQLVTATERAQAVWDRSAIAAAFRAHEITGAEYGVEEVETMYRSWIGGYGKWPEQPHDRDKWLADKAFHLTLINALDVDGYRAALRFLSDDKSDEEILVMLHEQRMESSHLPLSIRAVSEQWLKEYNHEKKKG